MTEIWQGSNGPLRWAIGKAMIVLIIGLIAALGMSFLRRRLHGSSDGEAMAVMPEERGDDHETGMWHPNAPLRPAVMSDLRPSSTH